jgi:hypothetical protein
MKRTIVLGASLMMLWAVLWMSFAQGSPTVKIAKLAPPTNVRLEAGENAIKVLWDASSDEADYNLAGYNVYFDTKSLVLLSPDHLPNAVQVGKRVHTCVVRGLENGRQYFFHVRSRNIVGGLSAASLPEKEAAPQPEGKNYAVSIQLLHQTAHRFHRRSEPAAPFRRAAPQRHSQQNYFHLRLSAWSEP